MSATPNEAITDWVEASPVFLDEKEGAQDMMLKRLMIEIGNDPYLSENVALTGGTTLHHVLLDQPLRYSEDLDLLMRVPAPGALKDYYHAWRERIAKKLGVLFQTRAHTEYPKGYLMWKLDSGEHMTISIDLARNPENVEVGERSVQRTIRMNSQWFSGSADVYCIHPTDLAASKIAACTSRHKPRDLYDLRIMRRMPDVSEIDIIDRFIESHMHANWNLDLAQKTADHHSSQEYCKIVEAEQEQAFLPNDYDLEAASRSYLEIAQSVNVELKKRSTHRTGSDKLGKILGGSMSPRLADRSAAQPKSNVSENKKKRILAIAASHPKATNAQIARAVGTSSSYVAQVLSGKRGRRRW